MDLLTLIRDRRSQRGPYNPRRPLRAEDLERILEAGRWAPTAHNMQNFELIVVDDRSVVQAIGSMGFSLSETFVRENYQQLSFSEEELARKKVGVLGTMFPPFMRKPDFRLADLTEEDRRAAASRVPLPQSSALLVVLYDPGKRAPASEGDFLGIMSLGCMMQNLWLMASSLGIGLQIVSSLASGPAETELTRILGIPPHLRVAFACRLGYAAPPTTRYLRVRRDIEDFVHHNHYGTRGLSS